MRRYTAGIVDDEQHGRDFAALLLSDHFPDIRVSLRADSVCDARGQLQRGVPDILFLDIELGDGSGFDLLPLLRGRDCQVIFITAYDQYAIQAIRNDALDYILKPVRTADFVAAVEKAAGRLAKLDAAKEKAFLPIATSQGIRRLEISAIVRCEADSNYTMFFLSGGKQFLVSTTLQEFEEQLDGHGFFRIHHKHLVNLAYVREYTGGKKGQAVLLDGTHVDVSVRRRNEFQKLMRQTGTI